MYRCVIVLLLFLCGLNSGHAQGIDCSHAHKPVERQICQSKPLMALDGELNKWYPRAKNTQLNPYEFETSHRQWLELRDACGTEDCIIAEYKTYIAELKGYPLFTAVENLPDITGGRDRGIDGLLSHNTEKPKRRSGTQFSVAERRWDVKPFFDHKAYLNLIEILKWESPFFGQNLSLTGPVAAINTPQQFYLYVLFEDYDPGHLPPTSILVQLAEDGDIKIVSLSDRSSRTCSLPLDAPQYDFSVDGDGLAFTALEHCKPLRRRWSVSQQALTSIAMPQESTQADGNAHDINWHGQCGDLSCYGHRGDPGLPFLAFHAQSANTPLRQSQQFSAFGGDDYTIYPDQMFLVNGTSNPKQIIGSNSRDAMSWFLYGTRNRCSFRQCYFVNAFGDYGLWQVDLPTMTLTRILPIQYIEKYEPISVGNRNYVFLKTEMSRNQIYVAREK
ncbi:hypothetical protein [Ochrobactrum sp. AN78]|uniref:lysozyme inhibitor LprI family protein n=1 Tax=Ochrobactrum sp. AN78 TaxID=3039853 RepID=UPI002989AA77|nr:hypothetical protein [Ochrobactrum sp. AN78]MDH7793786.1 uncharacterized protein YecT (DUF1311 family) [Ochrobactrum sp. AN78]